MDALAIFKRAKSNLSSENPRVRKVAIRVMGKLGDRNAIPYINNMLEDSDPAVRAKAAEVLHMLVDSSIKHPPLTTGTAKEMHQLMDEIQGNAEDQKALKTTVQKESSSKGASAKK